MSERFNISFLGQLPGSDKDTKKFHARLGKAVEEYFATLSKNDPQRFVDGPLHYAGNGIFGTEPIINLEDIHTGLGKADAFVFLPSNDLEHDLKLMSMFVGVQTGDENMFTTKIDGKKRQKPIIVVNEAYWKPILNLIEKTKFINREHKDNIIMPIETAKPDDIVAGIDLALKRTKPDFGQPLNAAAPIKEMTILSERPEPKFKVCVFCSASNQYFVNDIKDDDHNLAYQLGRKLATTGYGVISGAGGHNMMGDVVRGAQSIEDKEKGIEKGWTGGSNTPTIRAKGEQVPEGLDAYVDMPDIYKRMKVMIEGSDAFIVAPGGAGSIQEDQTMMYYILKYSNLMNGKPVAVLNPKDKDGHGYWDALIEYAKQRGLQDRFMEASTVEEANTRISKRLRKRDNPLSTPWSVIVERERNLPQTPESSISLAT